jgi:hypothetical protein
MSEQNVPQCGNCPMRKRAEENPNTFLARLWRWHTTWCPGWKAYQKWLAEHVIDRREAPPHAYPLERDR